MEGSLRALARPPPVFGREAELAVVDAFLARIPDGPAALVVAGEPGMGKTTLWAEAVRSASELGRVLSSRPAEAEVELPFAGLFDLLDPVAADVLPALPAPQRAALSAALFRHEPPAGGLERSAVGVAVLGGLRAVAEEAPLLLALDDVQWLDAASAEALAFALRRLADEPVGTLAAFRLGSERALALDDAFPRDRVDRIDVAPLDASAIDKLVADRLGLLLGPTALAALTRISGGNPFYALELARAAGRDGDFSEALAVPPSLAEVVSGRLAGLPEETRDTLLVVSALGQPTLDRLNAVEVAPAELERGRAAGVLEVANGRVAFAHPLLASAIYADAPAERRRKLHRELAAALRGTPEQARHLALATDAPDEEVAAALERASADARERGAPAEAARLAERAAALTPSSRPEPAARRALAAIRHHLTAGDVGRAQALAEGLGERLESGPARAEALLCLAECREDDLAVALDLLAQAEREAGAESGLLSEIEWRRGQVELGTGRTELALTTFESAVGHAEAAGDSRRLGMALAGLAFARRTAGEPYDEPLARALEIDGATPLPFFWGPKALRAIDLNKRGGVDETRRTLEGFVGEVEDAGDEKARNYLHMLLGRLEWRAGRLERALAFAREAERSAERSGGNQAPMLALRARVEATLGRVEAARAAGEQGVALARESGEAWAVPVALCSLGFLELSLADFAAALHWIDGISQPGGSGPGDLAFVAPDEIEALVGIGRLHDAERVLALLDDRTEAGDAWERAVAARARALVLSAKGEAPAAAEACAEALAHHERSEHPLEHARTLLVQGAALRRGRAKQAARDALEGALARFEAIGAPLWADRARAELGQLGGRPAGRAGELTPTEKRIAELVAAGRSNHEVASALFVSAKTVEWNLSKIYRKLRVRSRTELAAKLSRSRLA